MISSNEMLQGAIDAINPTKNEAHAKKAVDLTNEARAFKNGATELVDGLIEEAREMLDNSFDDSAIEDWILESKADVIAEWLWNDSYAEKLWPKLQIKNTTIQDLYECEEGSISISDIINRELVLYFTKELEPLKERIEYILNCDAEMRPPFDSQEEEDIYFDNKDRG